MVWRTGWCQPTIFETENCNEGEDVNTATWIADLVNWYEKLQVCIKRIKIGEYQNNRMDWLAMCIKLDQDQESWRMLGSAISIQKRIQQTYRVGDYPVTNWKGTAYGGKDQNGWHTIKYHDQHGTY